MVGVSEYRHNITSILVPYEKSRKRSNNKQNQRPYFGRILLPSRVFTRNTTDTTKKGDTHTQQCEEKTTTKKRKNSVSFSHNYDIVVVLLIKKGVFIL